PADPRILVLGLDLPPAFLDAHVHAHEGGALVGEGRVTEPAERDREVTRGLRRRVEMLVKKPVGRGEHASVLPIEPPQLALALPPVRAVALARARDGGEIPPLA